jgi:hypothetical protein
MGADATGAGGAGLGAAGVAGVFSWGRAGGATDRAAGSRRPAAGAGRATSCASASACLGVVAVDESFASAAGAEGAGVPTTASVSATGRTAGSAAGGAGAAATGAGVAAFWRTAMKAPPAAAVTQPAASRPARTLELMTTPGHGQLSNCRAPSFGTRTRGIQGKSPKTARWPPEPRRPAVTPLSSPKDPQSADFRRIFRFCRGNSRH